MQDLFIVHHWKFFAGVFLALTIACTALWFGNPAPLAESATYHQGFVLRDFKNNILRVGLADDDTDCRPTYHPSTNDWIVKAIVASEDSHFFEHHGVVLPAIIRSVRQNLSTGRRISGASTITMQTVRLIKPHKRSFLNKIAETFKALRLNRAMNKIDVLEQYLNRVPFGSNLIGIESASQVWFNCTPSELSLPEAALLAGLPQAPSRFRPDRHLDRALKRREYVFDRMEALGIITHSQRISAESLKFSVKQSPRPFKSPWFCDYVIAQNSGLKGDLRTTLDPKCQTIVDSQINSFTCSTPSTVSAVIISVKDSSVLAMSSSGNYFDVHDGQVNSATIARPAGSSLKPFAYAVAAEKGILTPKTVLPDLPLTFGNYSPKNFSGKYSGLVTAADSLILSLNLPAISLLCEIGIEDFISKLRESGISTIDAAPDKYGLSIILGSGSVKLVELANAYAVFARGGNFLPVKLFADLDDAKPSNPKRVFSKGVSWMISEILSGHERSQNAFGHSADVRLPRFAWKTGTSSGFRDAWTVAWNPEYVIAVWVGNKQGYCLTDFQTGINTASPILWSIIRSLYPNGMSPWFAKPDEIGERDICPVSGQARGTLCPVSTTDFFIKDKTLWTPCRVHKRDADGNVTVQWTPDIEAKLSEITTTTSSTNSTAEMLSIDLPKNGAQYKIVQGIPKQQIIFKVSGVHHGTKVHWFVNGHYNGVTLGSELFMLHMRKGEYTVAASTENGSSDEVTILVK